MTYQHRFGAGALPLKPVEGAVAPLFDRLRQAKTADEPQSLYALDRAGLRDSIRRELKALFNVRSPTPLERLESITPTVIDYGVPDFNAFVPADPLDRERLAHLLTRLIGAFEPRLHGIQVTVEPAAGDPQALAVQLAGSLVVEQVHEPIGITIIWSGRNDTSQLHLKEAEVLSAGRPAPRHEMGWSRNERARQK